MLFGPRFRSLRGHTVLASALGRAPFVVDLGANRGEFSKELQARVGGTYLLVEANPSLAAAMEGQDRVRHCAVAAADSVLQFHIARNDETSSLLPLSERGAYDSKEVETVRVPARRLESILEEEGSREVDLLKMDIEGAEVEVLLGLPESQLEKIKQMTVEFHCHPSFGLDLRDGSERAIGRMRDLGFLCIDFSHGRRMDVLFLNTKALKLSRFRQDRLRGQAALRIFLWRLRGWLFCRKK